MNWFKRLFSKRKNRVPQQVVHKPPTYKPMETYQYKRVDGIFTFRLGDKVICRSNECDPLTIGTIVEFWDNEGKWDNPIPYVEDENGGIWGIMGIMRPYSDTLYKSIENLKPLEQWNYFIPDEKYHYTQEDMVRKQTGNTIIDKNLRRMFKRIKKSILKAILIGDVVKVIVGDLKVSKSIDWSQEQLDLKEQLRVDGYNIDKGSIRISKDNYCIDGNHRTAILQELDPSQEISVIKLKRKYRTLVMFFLLTGFFKWKDEDTELVEKNLLNKIK